MSQLIKKQKMPVLCRERVMVPIKSNMRLNLKKMELATILCRGLLRRIRLPLRVRVIFWNVRSMFLSRLTWIRRLIRTIMVRMMWWQLIRHQAGLPCLKKVLPKEFWQRRKILSNWLTPLVLLINLPMFSARNPGRWRHRRLPSVISIWRERAVATII